MANPEPDVPEAGLQRLEARLYFMEASSAALAASVAVAVTSNRASNRARPTAALASFRGPAGAPFYSTRPVDKDVDKDVPGPADIRHRHNFQGFNYNMSNIYYNI